MNLRNPATFIESQVRLEPTGDLVTLEKWEKKVLADLFPNGIGALPYTSALISLPAKTGKTSFLSAVSCWHLFNGWHDSLGRPLILYIAQSKEMSTVLGFRKLVFAIENNPMLKDSCTIYRDRVKTSTGGEARCIPSGRPGAIAGVEYSMLVSDELHSADDSSMALMAELKPSSFRQSLILYASYAGMNKDGYFYHLWQIAEKKKDPKLYSLIGHDAQISSWVSSEHIASEKIRLPDWQWRRLYLNVWVDQNQVYIPSELWEACHDYSLTPMSPNKEIGLSVGVDVGLRRDTSSIIATYLDEDTVKTAFVEVFTPPKKGELDLEATVAKTLRFLAENYLVEQIVYDERYMVSIAQRLSAEGLPMTAKSSQRSSMSPVFESLYQRVKRGDLAYFKHKEMTSQIGNAVVVLTSTGVMVQKRERGSPVDCVIALALSSWHWEHQPTREIRYATVYDSENPVPLVETPTSMKWTRDHRPRKGGKLSDRISDLIGDASK